jgi:hypothetical protein
MTPININAFGSEIVFNNLYDTLSADWLDEDLVFIRLSDGTKVEVGWYTDPSDEGHFKIVLFKTSWDEPLEVIRTKDVHEVVKSLEWFALRASRPTTPTRSPDQLVV